MRPGPGVNETSAWTAAKRLAASRLRQIIISVVFYSSNYCPHAFLAGLCGVASVLLDASNRLRAKTAASGVYTPRLRTDRCTTACFPLPTRPIRCGAVAAVHQCRPHLAGDGSSHSHVHRRSAPRAALHRRAHRNAPNTTTARRNHRPETAKNNDAEAGLPRAAAGRSFTGGRRFDRCQLFGVWRVAGRRPPIDD